MTPREAMELIANLLGVWLDSGLDGGMDLPQARVYLSVGPKQRTSGDLHVYCRTDDDGIITIKYRLGWPSFNGDAAGAAQAMALHQVLAQQAILVESVIEGRSWKPPEGELVED